MKNKIILIKNWDELIWFGLHKNHTFGYLIHADSQYLEWMQKNTNIHLSKKLWNEYLKIKDNICKEN